MADVLDTNNMLKRKGLFLFFTAERLALYLRRTGLAENLPFRTGEPTRFFPKRNLAASSKQGLRRGRELPQ